MIDDDVDVKPLWSNKSLAFNEIHAFLLSFYMHTRMHDEIMPQTRLAVNPLGGIPAWRSTRLAVNHQSTYYSQ